jgi:hypothetical protein
MNMAFRTNNLEILSNKKESQIYIPRTPFSLLSYFLVFIAAAALYILTCMPGAAWQDSGVIQYRVWHNDIEGKLGLALSHPLFYLIAIPFKYIPLGEFTYRINIAGAIISAFAVANLFLFLRLWLYDTFAALLGAATLALSHTFWQHSTMPETYGLAVALLLLELTMLLQYAKTSRARYLYLLAFINGLAIANHMLASLALVCYFALVIILLLKKQLKLRHIFVMALFWIIGATPYEYLIVKNIMQTHDIAGTFTSAMFGAKWKYAVLNTTLTLPAIKENMLYILMNFPTPNILFLFVGLWCIYKVSPKRWFASVLIAMSLLYFIFAFRYAVQDRYAFFIPFYCLISIFIGVGVFRYVLKSGGAHTFIIAAFCLVVVPAYMKAPEIVERMHLKINSGREIPYRNDTEYFLFPWKMNYMGYGNYNSAEKFALTALLSVNPPAIIYADSTTAPPLLLMQEVRNVQTNKDIKIISSIGTSKNSPEFNRQTIDDLLSRKNVYVVSKTKGYCPDFLLERCVFKSVGVLYLAVDKKR